jgi:hypothetical protein
MSSPGAYITSIQPGIWYKIDDNQWMLPVFINATITANTNYGPFVVPKPLQKIFSVILTVSAVSGTSPTLTVGNTVYDLVAAVNGVYESGLGGTWFSNVSATGSYAATYSNTSTGVILVYATVGGTSPSFTATLTIYIMT